MEFMTGVNKKDTVEISEILAGDFEGKTVKVNGAVHTIRDMGEPPLNSPVFCLPVLKNDLQAEETLHLLLHRLLKKQKCGGLKTKLFHSDTEK